MTEFYTIMLKRQDGKVYADLHKTNQNIYLTIEDAYEEWYNNEHYKQHYHIVKLIASLEDTSQTDP
jgi:archaellum component FlaF (FlaF/FlaG flagellin family)